MEIQSEGVRIGPDVRYSPTWDCPGCGRRIHHQDIHDHVVGFDKNPPFWSSAISVAAAVIECPKCFQKYWFHIEELFYLSLKFRKGG